MKQYCRYCSALVAGNGIWCDIRQRELSEGYTKRPNNCNHFDFNEIDAYDLEKRYKPRAEKKDDGQLKLELGV